ncbi:MULTISPECIES: shikimate kinase [Okeania]|uniref:Shikimate kinase n=1 Tax=Okeania hirsuta TaxID=1458930 RepID=A0A3N6R189_9CYAN|nr:MULTISPECIES: shikimate kinase [Okeania]NEP08654.1 shikimate kinase [Okeania sp. SIO4D6]NEP70582.1 shikimate kinase [Okeania sp. SIO2G5]NEP93267.1 shikimate kinase [Okeania sp. SIO2F5]NEQ89249.1 shikimate kinase [Okeania sp. SIO2G4]NES77952.1 shikimate kinase [Okeania sp. SIO1H4]
MNVSNKKFLQGVNLYLVGMMGAGKTTVGELLSQNLGYRFLDTDNLISQVAGKSINEIFADDGEAAFRQLETNVLAQVSSYKNLTIATGGGIVLNHFNWSYLQHGIVVWLDAPIEVLHSRLQGDQTRPLLQDRDPLGKLQALLEERRPLYANADVHIHVEPKSTPEQLTMLVLAEVKKVVKSSVLN